MSEHPETWTIGDVIKIKSPTGELRTCTVISWVESFGRTMDHTGVVDSVVLLDDDLNTDHGIVRPSYVQVGGKMQGNGRFKPDYIAGELIFRVFGSLRDLYLAAEDTKHTLSLIHI